MSLILFGYLAAYPTMWILAAVVGVAAGVAFAHYTNLPKGRSALAIAVLASVILVGSKLLYLAELSLYPRDDYVPLSERGWLHGFRIPGGILLLSRKRLAGCCS
jgi:hypothetical protein